MKVGIIGATGYAGAELLRLLAAHPETETVVLASTSQAGESIEAVYPNFAGIGRQKCDAILKTPEQAAAASDIVFGALPAGAGEPYAASCLERGVSYIDLAADFRFGCDEETYARWYGKNWQRPELRKRCAYGLPEMSLSTNEAGRAKIKALAASGPLVVGNPGCYPTAVTLAAMPALSGGLAARQIIADAVSGVTGAGKDLARMYHFPECADSVTAYKVGAHRHTPEIARNFAQIAGSDVPVVFTPHLGPYNRGILATVYIPLAEKFRAELTADAARKIYADFYQNEFFVRVLPDGLCAATNRVRQSNFCDISVHLSHDCGTLIAIAAIDNMVKGAAGQAVQNANIILGFEETAGLAALPAAF
jgi:N-acetyl-gamma-glutamyl-phosphate reductase